MTLERVRQLFAKFDSLRVVVVGDIYLDEISRGLMMGTSLETPVPVIEIAERRHNPGAAGNTACNLATLGARTKLIGVVGADNNAQVLREELAKYGVDGSHLVTDFGRPTNTYGKLLARAAHGVSQEVLRTDTPTPPQLSSVLEREVIEAIDDAASNADAIVVVDQVGSVATDGVLEAIAALAAQRNLLTVADSRGRIGRFRGFRVAVPNDGELGQSFGIDTRTPDGFAQAAKRLFEVCESGLITCGERGITGVTKEGTFTSPALARRVVDVTGAGDTVTAAVTLTLLAGASLEEAAYAGNAAAAVAIAQPGVVTVSRDEVIDFLTGGGQSDKVQALPTLKHTLAKLRTAGKRVVWTNGCFDIIHAGHVSYLERAAREGDVLVVGLNSDRSVRAIKGPDRPIVPEAERAVILGAFAAVDYVTVFDDASPLGAIETLRPDVYAKGGDYTVDTINQEERRLVEGYGGRIAIIPGVDGRSTTNIVRRLSAEYHE